MSNVPDDFHTYRRTCPRCGDHYHPADEECACPERMEQLRERVGALLDGDPVHGLVDLFLAEWEERAALEVLEEADADAEGAGDQGRVRRIEEAHGLVEEFRAAG